MYNLWPINYLDCPGTERQMKVPLTLYKPCPFCYYESYLYKTYPGLLRHLIRFHLRDENDNQLKFSHLTPRKLIIYTSYGTEIIDIDNFEELEEFLKDYVIGKKNPSRKSARLWRYVDEESKKD